MRQGTSYRPQSRMVTGRQGTGVIKDQGFNSAAANTNVSIPDRAITRHGITGIKASQPKHERQIADRNYYVTELKKKIREIYSEIQKFQNEIDEINRDNSTYVTLERKSEVLNKDVRQFEGELADYNLALDKQRTDTRPEDIMAMYEHIKAYNDKQRHQIDDLFMERKSYEDQIGQIEQEINHINIAAEEKLNELDPDKRQHYEQLKQDNQNLLQNIDNYKGELEELNERLGEADAKLRSDTVRQQYHQLKERHTFLTKKKEDLEIQTNETNLSFPEVRERLLQRVKEDNAQVANSEKKMHELNKTIDSYQKQIKEMESDLEERKMGDREVEKYQVLHQKDQEMTQFIENYDELKGKEMQEMEQLEQTIMGLLAHQSTGVQRKRNMPDRGDYSKMQDEERFKTDQTVNAAITYERLKGELDHRKGELDKLDSLDIKINKELQQVKEKIDQMNSDMTGKFRNVDQVKQQAAQEKVRLAHAKDLLAKRKDVIIQQVRQLSVKYEAKKYQLSQNETHAAIVKLEQKITNQESQIYQMRQFIEVRGRESNYQHALKDCNALVSDINGMVVRNVLSLK